MHHPIVTLPAITYKFRVNALYGHWSILMSPIRSLRTLCLLIICASATVILPLSVEAQQPAISPRYKDKPIYLLFEHYIMDVVGQLPPEKSASIQAMNLQKVFNTKASEWHASLREALALSQTIDIAILDLWYRNQDIAQSKGIEYPSRQFAMDFTDEYFKDGSQVDVWPPGALEAAKQRIAIHRNQNTDRSH
jgi:hypothetical protein